MRNNASFVRIFPAFESFSLVCDVYIVYTIICIRTKTTHTHTQYVCMESLNRFFLVYVCIRDRQTNTILIRKKKTLVIIKIVFYPIISRYRLFERDWA